MKKIKLIILTIFTLLFLCNFGYAETGLKYASPSLNKEISYSFLNKEEYLKLKGESIENVEDVNLDQIYQDISANNWEGNTSGEDPFKKIYDSDSYNALEAYMAICNFVSDPRKFAFETITNGILKNLPLNLDPLVVASFSPTGQVQAFVNQVMWSSLVDAESFTTEWLSGRYQAAFLIPYKIENDQKYINSPSDLDITVAINYEIGAEDYKDQCVCDLHLKIIRNNSEEKIISLKDNLLFLGEGDHGHEDSGTYLGSSYLNVYWKDIVEIKIPNISFFRKPGDYEIVLKGKKQGDTNLTDLASDSFEIRGENPYNVGFEENNSLFQYESHEQDDVYSLRYNRYTDIETDFILSKYVDGETYQTKQYFKKENVKDIFTNVDDYITFVGNDDTQFSAKGKYILKGSVKQNNSPGYYRINYLFNFKINKNNKAFTHYEILNSSDKTCTVRYLLKDPVSKENLHLYNQEETFQFFKVENTQEGKRFSIIDDNLYDHLLINNYDVHWDFGDGTGATGKSVTHMYDSSDNFNVKVSVIPSSGSDSPVIQGSCNVNSSFTAPVASAGTNKSVTGNGTTQVCLNGSSSYGQGNLTYQWSQVSGRSVDITDSNSLNPCFIAPDVNSSEKLIFQLKVVDEYGQSDTDQVNVFLYPESSGHDLKLKNFVFNRDEFDPGQNIECRVKIENLGDYDEKFFIDFHIQGNDIDETITYTYEHNTGLFPGSSFESKMLDWEIPASVSEGQFLKIKIEVRPKGGDEDLSNNIAEPSVYIGELEEDIDTDVYVGSDTIWPKRVDDLFYSNPFNRMVQGCPVTLEYNNQTYELFFQAFASKVLMYVKRNGAWLDEGNYEDIDYNEAEFIDGTPVIVIPTGNSSYGCLLRILVPWDSQGCTVRDNSGIFQNLSRVNNVNIEMDSVLNINESGEMIVDIGLEGDDYEGVYKTYSLNPFERIDLEDSADGESINKTSFTRTNNGGRLEFTALKEGDHNFILRFDTEEDDLDIFALGKIKVFADTDNDGVVDENDKFPADPAASSDTDNDGYPDNWNFGYSAADSTTGLSLDKFPEDPAAAIDSDDDGYPDEWNEGYSSGDSTTGLYLDKFPDDPSVAFDSDDDGYPDTWNEGFSSSEVNSDLYIDKFPYDPAASKDHDNDGSPESWNSGYSSSDSVMNLHLDKFPEDPSISLDTDNDGYPDTWNAGYSHSNKNPDLYTDKFPDDPAASADTDNDGSPDFWNVGFNASDSTTGLVIDKFINDSAASIDTDGDGYPDSWNSGYTSSDINSELHLDSFPEDYSASVDTDNDGFPDYWNKGLTSADTTSGLKRDDFPFDSTLHENRDIGLYFINRNTPYVMISSGANHIVGLKPDGTVIVAGPTYAPHNVSNWKDIIQVSAGYDMTLGLKRNGTVLSTSEEFDVSDWTDIKQVAAGAGFAVGLKKDGTVIAAGDNSSGKCNVEDWKNIVQVSVSNKFTIGLKSDGTVVSTGRNIAGACEVDNWKDIVQVDAGQTHTVGLKSDGTVVYAGDKEYEQENGEYSLESWTDIVQVSAGQYNTVGLKSDGTVLAGGLNEARICDVSGWKDVAQISSGLYNIVGLLPGGKVLADSDNAALYGSKEVVKWDLIKSGRMVKWRDNIAVDYDEKGLFLYSQDSGDLIKLADKGYVNKMEACTDFLFVDFGKERGCYLYEYNFGNENVSQSKISSWGGVNHLISFEETNRFYADFGEDKGVYYYSLSSGSWHWITNWGGAPKIKIQTNSENPELIFDFGKDKGLYSFDSSADTWKWLTNWGDVETIEFSESMTKGEFLTEFDNSVYLYTSNGWEWITNWGTEAISYPFFDFGNNGLYKFEDSEWHFMSLWNPKILNKKKDSILLADFGREKGLYQFDNQWEWIGKGDVKNIYKAGLIYSESLFIDYGSKESLYKLSADSTDFESLAIKGGFIEFEDLPSRGEFVIDNGSNRNLQIFDYDANLIMNLSDLVE